MAPFVSKLPRTFWIVTDLEKYDSSHEVLNPYPSGKEVCESATADTANTISSLLEGDGNWHAPCLDIDWRTSLRWIAGANELDIWCALPVHYKFEETKLDEAGEEYHVVEGVRPIGMDAVRVWADWLLMNAYIVMVWYVFSEDYERAHFRIRFAPDIQLASLPSKTPMHYHVYIDTRLTWLEYKTFIQVLANLGIVQEGFRAMTERRDMSHLRIPSPELFNSRPTKGTLV